MEHLTKDSRVDSAAWFTQGMQGPWLGVIGESAAFGDLAAPVRDKSGQIIGVVGRALELAARAQSSAAAHG